MKCPICLANRETLGRLDYAELLRAARQFNIEEYNSTAIEENVRILRALQQETGWRDRQARFVSEVGNIEEELIRLGEEDWLAAQ